MTEITLNYFLKTYFGGATGKVLVAAIRNSKSKLSPGQIARVITRDANKIQNLINQYDKPEYEAAIVFSTATLKTGATSRRSENCHQIISLFGDVDDKNHDLGHDEALRRLMDCACPPSIVIDSGHGWHPHWILTAPAEDVEIVRHLRQHLEGLIASDPVSDLARVMRLPFTHNSKPAAEGGVPDWLPVDIRHISDTKYTVEQIEAWLNTEQVLIPRKQAKSNGHDHHRDRGEYGHHHRDDGRRYDDDRPDRDEVRDALQSIPASDRKMRIDIGMALKATFGDSGRPLWDEWLNAAMAELPQRKRDRAWNGFGRREGITIRTVFGLAIDHGWHSARPRNGYNGTAGQSRHNGNGSAKQDAKTTLLESTAACSIEMAAVEWCWPGRFAFGKLGLIVGLPDEGKGQTFCYMAAMVTTGGKWPCNEGTAPVGNVLLLTAEDDLNDTVVPRLAAAGADLSRVEIIKMVRDEKNKRRMFSLVTDLELLRQKIVEVGGIVLVLIDPVSAYLGHGRVDTFRTSDVRAVLAPLVDLAAEQKIAIVGIMHFNKKIDVTNALLRISDSLAFGATARHVYAVVDDAEHGRKLIVRGKNNLARRKDKALAYRFLETKVGTDSKSGKEIFAPHIVFDPEHVDVTASEAMQAATESRAPTARDDAKKFLADLLASGPMPSTEIEEAAKANAISRMTLFRAKIELKVTAKRDGDKGAWRWHMPKPDFRNWMD